MIVKLTPESSNIYGYSYNPTTAELFIDYNGGGRYKYVAVPLDVVENMQKAESIGKFVNQAIKPNFMYDKVEDNGDVMARLKNENTVYRDTIRQQAEVIERLSTSNKQLGLQVEEYSKQIDLLEAARYAKPKQKPAV